MSQINKGKQWGPIGLVEGVNFVHVWTYMWAAFYAIGILGFFNFGQALVLTTVLGIPQGELGAETAGLQLWGEILAILFIPIAGILSDRYGRRIVLVIGTALLGLTFFLYPYADSMSDLYLFRVLHALAAAAMSSTMATIVNDYPKESDRGTFVGIASIFNGLGVVTLILTFGRLPFYFEGQGMDPVEAVKTAWLIITIICIIAAVIFQFGLKGGTPSTYSQRIPFKTLFVDGIKAAKNPRIALAYANSFAARADLTIIGLFVSLWAVKVAPELNISENEAAAAATNTAAVASTVALFWSPFMGRICDRMNRVSAMGLAAFLAAVGYLSIGFIESPVHSGAIPYFALLGFGYVSGLIASTALIGQEAPVAERGTIIGFFSMTGAMGILFVAVVGGLLFDVISSGPFLLMGVINIFLFVWCMIVRFKAGEPEPGRDDLTVVVTGSTRGIGLGLAEHFLRLNNDVVITGRSQSSVDKALSHLAPIANETGRRIIGVPCDVSDEAQLENLWTEAAKTFGKVDVWINNAGIANKGMAIAELDEDQFDSVVHTNVLGMINASRIALREMEKQGFGEIYNFEGFGSDGRQNPGLSVYGSTKNALTHFTKSLIKETKKSPVKVCYMSPGIVITDMSVGEGQINPERVAQTKKVYNIIGDKVETVTPWLAKHTLLNDRHGARVAWLTRGKVIWRFANAWRNKDRDLFAETGRG